MAPLMAMSVPVSVSPRLMLETSMASMVVGVGSGLSCMGFGFRLVCPRNVGVISSVVSVCDGSVSA